MKTVIINLLIVLIFSLSQSMAQEKIVTKNNDQIKGEVKGLSLNVLQIDPDYGENIFEIDWDEVINFESARTFIIILSSNERITGVITTLGMSAGKIKITTNEGEVKELEITEIVDMTSVDKTFWERIEISIDGGYSLTKANNNSQLSLGGNINYLTEKTMTDANFSVVNSTVQDSIKTNWSNANLAFRRFLKGSTFALSKIDFLQSDEQNIDLRTTFQLGLGYSFINSNIMMLSTAGGAAFNNENLQDETLESNRSGELFAAIDFKTWDYKELSLTTTTTVFPSLTENERVRIKFNIDLKWDLPLEFYFKIAYDHSFDSKPIASATKNDYVFQTSIGWEW